VLKFLNFFLDGENWLYSAAPFMVLPILLLLLGPVVPGHGIEMGIFKKKP
jgi:hypothetical protein